MFCSSCGKENDANARFCSSCGRTIQAPNVVVQESNWIPKNSYALFSYYLGFASVFFCILTGIPAVILGFIALRKARETPSLKGENHAWVGIILGALSVLFLLAVFVMILAED